MFFLEEAGHIGASPVKKGLTSVASSSKPKSQPTSQTCLPWTEKYRPKVQSDIVGNQALVCV